MLKSANLSTEKQQLASATITELTYDNMKKPLKAIHDNSTIVASYSFIIKSEQNYFAKENYESVLYGNSSTRGFNNYRKGSSGNKHWRSHIMRQKLVNADKYGQKNQSNE